MCFLKIWLGRVANNAAVICVMHGISFGMAVDIACCADVRVCSENTRLAVKEVDIGLAADLGSLARLPKIVASSSWVRDVCLTAREFLAPEAQAVGFVSRVLPSKAAAVAYALDMAKLIASKSPVAVQGTKELLNHSRDHSVPECKSRSLLNARPSIFRNIANLQLSNTRRCGTRRPSRATMCRRHCCLA